MSEEKKPETQTFSVSQAEKIVALAQRQKAQNCWAKLNAQAQQDGFVLVAEAYITPEGRIGARPKLVPMPNQ